MAPKYTDLSNTVADPMVISYYGAIHLSDGTLAYLGYDGTTTYLKWSSDRSSIQSLVALAAPTWYQNDFILCRDAADNIYAIGTDGTTNTNLRVQAFTKGSGHTWTAQASVESAFAAFSTNFDFTATWCDTGGGTNGAGHIVVLVGEAGSTTGHNRIGVLDAGAILAGSSSFLVQNYQDPTCTGGLSATTPSVHLSPDGFGAPSGLSAAAFDTGGLNIGSWGIDSAGALTTNTLIEQDTIGGGNSERTAALIRYGAGQWLYISPWTNNLWGFQPFTATAAGTSTHMTVAPTNMPSVSMSSHWDAFADPTTPGYVWLLAAGLSGTTVSCCRLLVDLTSGSVVWATAASVDDTITSCQNFNWVRAVSQPVSQSYCDWQVGVESSAAARWMIAGEYTQFVAPNPTAPDASGTLSLPVATLTAGSNNNTLIFTYTPPSGDGLTGGEVTVVIPAGWPAPSLTPTDPGYVTASTGSVSLSGSTIQVSGVSLSPGQILTITYGDRTGGGPGLTAPGAGASTFSAQEKSTASGTLGPISSPSVTTYAPVSGSGSLDAQWLFGGRRRFAFFAGRQGLPRILSAPVTPVSGSDSGHGTDASVLVGSLSSSGTGSGTDASVLVASVASSGSGTGADSALVASATTAVEAGSAVDQGTGLITASVVEAASGSETSVLAGYPVGVETASGADAGVVSALLSLSSGDAGSGGDAASLFSGFRLGDNGSGAEAASLVSAGADAESGAGTELASSIAIAGFDAGSGSDGALVAASAAGADTASGVEATAVALSVAEAGSGVDISTLVVGVAGAETGAGADAMVLVWLVGAETGAGLEAAALSTDALVADQGSGSELAALSAALALADIGAGADAGTMVGALGGTEVGAGSESVSIAVPVVGADTGTGADTGSLSASIGDLDVGTGTETLTGSVVVLATETALETDSVVGLDLAGPAESGTGLEAATVVSGPLPQNESGAASETGSVVGVIVAGDLATASEATSVGAGLSGADLAEGTETASVQGALNTSDAGNGSEGVPALGSVGADEAASGSDVGLLAAAQTSADAGHGADAQDLLQAKSDTDTATGTDGAGSLALEVAEDGSAAEGYWILKPVLGADAATGSDSVALAVQVQATQSGQGGEAGSLLITSLEQPESGSGTETEVVSYLWFSADAGSGSDGLGTVVAVLADADSAEAVETFPIIGIAVPDYGTAIDTEIVGVPRAANPVLITLGRSALSQTIAALSRTVVIGVVEASTAIGIEDMGLEIANEDPALTELAVTSADSSTNNVLATSVSVVETGTTVGVLDRATALAFIEVDVVLGEGDSPFAITALPVLPAASGAR